MNIDQNKFHEYLNKAELIGYDRGVLTAYKTLLEMFEEDNNKLRWYNKEEEFNTGRREFNEFSIVSIEKG